MIVRNVKDIDGGDRRSLEHVVGRQLSDSQQVIIRVVELAPAPDQATKRRALDDLAQLSEKGSQHREAQGVTEAEASEALDEAIRETRRQQRQQAG